MTRNNKIRLIYLGMMIILASIFIWIGRSDMNFWLMLERMDYVRTIAKIITIIAIVYFAYDFIVGNKISKRIVEFVLTEVVLLSILYYLFN